MTQVSDTSSLTASQQMIASCTGAVAVSLFSTPFDVVKVRLQAQLKPSNKCFLFSNGLMEHVCQCGIPPALTEPLKCRVNGNVQTIYFRSTFDAFVKIVKYEGVPQLWKGLPPTMIMAVPQTVVYFTSYDQLKSFLGWNEIDNNIAIPLTSGMVARAFAVAAISPLELIRTKLQAREGYRYHGTSHCDMWIRFAQGKELFGMVRGAIRQEGLSSLWRGMGPTLLRDLPFSGLYWSLYEFFKGRCDRVSFSESFTAGALAGVIAAFLTTPFDVIKTHRQMELGESMFGNQNNKVSPWTFNLILKLWRENGLMSLYTGTLARLAKVAPACAVMISTYEYGKRYFAVKNEKWRAIENLS